MNELKVKSFELRQVVLDMIKKSVECHIGGDFSVMDILVTLYFKHMNISPENMDDPNRDLFVMSKGHSVESYYAVLAAKGFFPTEEVLEQFSAFGSSYIGHPNNKLPGIEMNSGSLGHGLPVCVGMALCKHGNCIYILPRYCLFKAVNYLNVKFFAVRKRLLFFKVADKHLFHRRMRLEKRYKATRKLTASDNTNSYLFHDFTSYCRFLYCSASGGDCIF